MATTLTIRLDDELHQELVSVAAAQGVTLSELTRRTLSSLLTGSADTDEDARTGRAATPTTMRTVERHQLAMLHRILGHLVTGDDDEGDREHQLGLAKIIESGYVLDYDDVFAPIAAELPVQDARLVMDILEMFYFLEWSFNKLSQEERDDLGAEVAFRVRFRGFDFNSRREGRLHGFAKYLIDNGKWEDLAVYFDRAHDGGNSHMPMLGTYERMLNEFNPIWRDRIRDMTSGRQFDARLKTAEISRIAGAFVHPYNRGK